MSKMKNLLIIIFVISTNPIHSLGQNMLTFPTDSLMQNMPYSILMDSLYKKDYRLAIVFRHSLGRPYWRTCHQVNKTIEYDSTNRFEQRYLIKKFSKIDSISWKVSNYLLTDTSFINNNDPYYNMSDQVFCLKKDTNNLENFLFLGAYGETNRLGSSMFLFQFKDKELIKIPIQKVANKFSNYDFTLRIDSVYDNKNSPYLEYYLSHHRFDSKSYILTERINGYVSRLKWNGKTFEHRLLYEWNELSNQKVPIEVHIDLQERGEKSYYSLKRGEVYTFKGRNYFICSKNDETEDIQVLYVYRCNSEDYDCELITKLDVSKFHFNDSIKVTSKLFFDIIEIGEGSNTLKIKMKK
jgi:hypothetical protein